jgi:16S rRNA (cytosine1402-N4)-methyltransferase
MKKGRGRDLQSSGGEPAGGGHEPVLLREFLEAAAVKPGDRWVDGTFGRGGHTGALLERGAAVLALDRDAEAEPAAAALAEKWPGQLMWKKNNFSNLKECSRKHGWERVSGVLIDLGVSSPQIETARRGLSFSLNGPLDMRMDQSEETMNAAHLVQALEERELARIFYEYGGERESRRVARVIVERRQRNPILTTQDLAEIVAAALGRRRARGIHPATKVFQALRIAVNREQEALLAVLPQAAEILETNGMLAAISFHSGEDRVVKDFLRRHSGEWLDTPVAPQSFRNPVCYFSEVRRYLPTAAEMERNPRSRSARLRTGRRNEVHYES